MSRLRLRWRETRNHAVPESQPKAPGRNSDGRQTRVVVDQAPEKIARWTSASRARDRTSWRLQVASLVQSRCCRPGLQGGEGSALMMSKRLSALGTSGLQQDGPGWCCNRANRPCSEGLPGREMVGYAVLVSFLLHCGNSLHPAPQPVRASCIAAAGILKNTVINTP